ncbi:hypothetical protein [Leucobacter musarum]|uniref:hypothetical protein n=1 Tax=Leucobacter musarum TaxID=1930747 RepID=UPI0006A7CE81|nr:hypothetical protein [Leucobacter musarum]
MSDRTPAHPGDITWARIEDDFFVGSRGGEFLGSIDREAPGTYVVCDQFSQPIGEHANLEAAMAALTAASGDAYAETGAA